MSIQDSRKCISCRQHTYERFCGRCGNSTIRNPGPTFPRIDTPNHQHVITLNQQRIITPTQSRIITSKQLRAIISNQSYAPQVSHCRAHGCVTPGCVSHYCDCCHNQNATHRSRNCPNRQLACQPIIYVIRR